MPLLDGIIGFGTGVFLRCTAATASKQRYFHAPWRHLIWGITGGVIGYTYDANMLGLLTKVNELRADRGMPVIQRRSWIFYLENPDLYEQEKNDQLDNDDRIAEAEALAKEKA